ARARYASACLAMLVILVAATATLFRMMPEPGRAFVTATALQIPPRAPAQTSAAISNHITITDIVPWLAPLWIIGVLLFNLRAARSWLAARRLRTKGVCLAPECWQERAHELAQRLGLGKAAVLLESSLAAGPVAVGFIRPVILMPIGMLTGMPTSQVESIMLHELAHIQRRDYLANLLQTVIEGLLFYHPAVWWISHVVRAERENCCDDLVVSASGNAHDYAAALSALAENRLAAAALPATGGSLVKRIRRLLYPEQTAPSFLMPLLSAVAVTLLTAWAATAWQSPVESSRSSTAANVPQLDRRQQYARPEPRQIVQALQSVPAALPRADAVGRASGTKLM